MNGIPGIMNPWLIFCLGVGLAHESSSFEVRIRGSWTVRLSTRSPSTVMPFYPFLGEGSPMKMDVRRKGTLILTSLLEDLAPGSVAFAWQCG